MPWTLWRLLQACLSRSKSDLLSIEVTAGRLTNACCNIVKENNWLGTSEMVNRRYAINNLTLPLSAAQFVLAVFAGRYLLTQFTPPSLHSFSYALPIAQPEMLRIVETTAYLKFACSRDFPTSTVRGCHVVSSPRSQRKTNIKALGSFGRLEAVESFHGVGRDHTSTLPAGR